jgi:hypothetical protein
MKGNLPMYSQPVKSRATGKWGVILYPPSSHLFAEDSYRMMELQRDISAEIDADDDSDEEI